MAHYLAIDTVSAKPSIALEKDGQIFTCALSAGRKQSKTLLDELEAVLSESDVSLKDISQLAVLTGPGSFTGIRVGLSFLKGLSIALNVPLSGMNHFDLIETILPGQGHGIIILESGRQEKFCHFTQNGRLSGRPFNVDPNMISTDDLKGCLYKITDFDADLLPDIQSHPYDEITAGLLLQNMDKTDQNVAPFYIRDADTSTPKKSIL